MNKTIYILTAFGCMIDTICEIYTDYDSARNIIINFVKEHNATEEVICKDIWKTFSKVEDCIEWQIWKKSI